MKTITQYINEFLVKKHLRNRKNEYSEWKSIIAYNENGMIYSLSNYAFNLNMRMVNSTYADACDVHNIGSADRIKVIKYILNKCLEDILFPSAQDVADALNKSKIGYDDWEGHTEDDKSVTIKRLDSNKDVHFITCSVK